MKVALVVNRIDKSIENNLKNITNYINKAADQKADLVLFSETALTGLINDDNPEHDIQLGIKIPGDVVDVLCEVARKRNINVSIGVFESENESLYDTAIFINRSGEIGLKYRRMTSGWHDQKLHNSIYKEGTEIKTYKADIGNVCFLICGDLFDNDLVNKVKSLDVDYLLFPFARSFYDGSISQAKWEDEELEEYINQVKKTNTTTLASNYIDEKYFGGAFIISGDGQVISSLDLGKEAMLIGDV